MCGLFDFFDRFNFTIDENDPTDADVSVDPEMLGKIFENLLEDNKDKGAFYTPKEIVGYMCNESLIAYLESECSALRHSERSEESSIRSLVVDLNADSFNEKERETLDQKLSEVKICDPAIGSGAFPMGLLNLLYKTRLKLGVVQKKSKNPEATLKREIIQQNIYGVDIEKGAVDIAQLRFWLSLVVDEVEPDALPNLEYKIMQGNSLLESFEGIDLSTLVGEGKRTRKKAGPQIDLVFDEKQAMEAIQKNLNSFYKTDSYTEKVSLKTAINAGVKDYLKFIAPEKSAIIDALQLPNDKFFLWHTYFRDVFDRKGKSGFDIVIGNPPYFVYEGFHKNELNDIKKDENLAIAYGGKLNAYKLFFAKALNVLACEKGKICFIFQNSFMADKQAFLLRKHIFEKKQLLCVDSFPERDNSKKRVFESVKMSVCIVLVNNFKSSTPFKVNFWDDRDKTSGVCTKFTGADIKCLDSESLSIPRIPIEFKPLVLKIKTIKNALFSKCFQGELNMTVHRAFFTQDSAMPKVFKGAAIQRYFTTDDMSQGIVEFVNESKYLKAFPSSEKAKHHCHERIAMQGMSGANDKIRLISTLIPANHYLAHSCNYIIPIEGYSLYYLLGIVNSKLINWYFRCFSTNSNVNSYEIEAIPFPSVSTIQQQPIANFVDFILAAKKKDPSADTSKQEAEIDKLVYKLYGLTDEEIAIVEGREVASSTSSCKEVKTAATKDKVATSDDWLSGEEL